MLHPVILGKNKRLYCGPTSIAAVTGFEGDKVIKMIRRYRGDRDRKYYGKHVKGGELYRSDGKRRAVRGMYNYELLEIMRRAGFKPKKERTESITLKQFCDDYGHLGPFIVEVTGHYVAVSQGKVLDTLTGYVPIEFKDYKRLKRRVKKWWQF